MDGNKEYILITGATSGIGCSIAVNLSRSYNLILHGRDEEKLEKTKALCDQGKHLVLYRADLAASGELESSLAGLITEQGLQIAHFVHCAGYMKMLPLKVLTLETIQRSFAVNVIAATLIVKVLTQRKVNNALKSVVFISSNISNFGAKAFSAYAGSKAALDAVMKCLAVELAPKVRLNSVLPGAIPTEMTKDIFGNKEVVDRMLADYPLGMGEAGDIFEMVNFLISDKSRWITGQQFVVDGGRSINLSA